MDRKVVVDGEPMWASRVLRQVTVGPARREEEPQCKALIRQRPGREWTAGEFGQGFGPAGPALRNLAIGVIKTAMPGSVAGAHRRLMMNPELLLKMVGA